MSNIGEIRREPVMVTLSDGKEREFRYTLNSFALMEERYGSIEAAMEEMEGGKIAAVRFMLWTGLVDGDPELTEMKVGSLIDIRQMPEMTTLMNAMVEKDMPDAEATGTVSPN